jgi:HEAT repeat protein
MGPDAVPSLCTLLEDENPEVRAIAANTLREIAAAAAAMMPDSAR